MYSLLSAQEMKAVWLRRAEPQFFLASRGSSNPKGPSIETRCGSKCIPELPFTARTVRMGIGSLSVAMLWSNARRASHYTQLLRSFEMKASLWSPCIQARYGHYSPELGLPAGCNRHSPRTSVTRTYTGPFGNDAPPGRSLERNETPRNPSGIHLRREF